MGGYWEEQREKQSGSPGGVGGYWEEERKNQGQQGDVGGVGGRKEKSGCRGRVLGGFRVRVGLGLVLDGFRVGKEEKSG